MKYCFNLRNVYNYNEEDLTPLDHSKSMQRKITLTDDDSREIIIERLKFNYNKVIPKRRQEVTERKITQEENDAPDPEVDINPNFGEYNAVQQHMIKEQCLTQNSLRNALEKKQMRAILSLINKQFNK